MPSLRARFVHLGGDDWLAPGEIEWDGRGRIVAVRRCWTRVADVAVFPGLVDAHVHLQLPPLGRRAASFVGWVRAVLAARASERTADLRRTAVASLRELLATGTTAVGEIDSSGASPAALRQVPLAGRCYQELAGFRLDAAGAEALLRARSRRGTRICPAGLSPHAPYSVSAALFAAAAAHCRHLAVHTAEVPEEQQFLRTGRGPFADLLAELGRLPERWRAPGVGAVRQLERLAVLGPATQLIHCQELERGDAARIARAGASIAVCPGTIAYFRRPPPPVPGWLALGITVALGTDSRASNTGLSMVAELARAAALWPELSPATLLAMATSHGGRALGRKGLGRLVAGGRADFIAVAAGGDRPEPALAAFVHGERPVLATWLGGRRCAARAC